MTEQGTHWQPMATAPKDGSTIIVPLTGAVRVFWCDELKTWVLNHPLHVESIAHPEGWSRRYAKQANGEFEKGNQDG